MQLHPKQREKYLKEFASTLSARLRDSVMELPTPKNMPELKSAYLFGKMGTGKSTMAVLMMREYLLKYWDEGYFPKVEFIQVPMLLLDFKDSFGVRSPKDKPWDFYWSGQNSGLSEKDLVVKYGSKLDLLVLDDFGTEYTTDWAFQMLYMVINSRYENKLMTIFTSNLSLDDLTEKLKDGRLPSRISEMCKVVRYEGKNYRE